LFRNKLRGGRWFRPPLPSVRRSSQFVPGTNDVVA